MRPPTELDFPIALDRTAPQPLQLQLAAQLRRAADAGTIPVGGRLPASRLLAERLSISRSTVVAAYDQLIGEGYLESRHGSGTYLSPRIGEQSPPRRRRAQRPRTVEAEPDLVDLRPGQPDTTRLVDQTWRSSWRRAAGRPVPVEPPAAQGEAALRAQIADHLRTARGADVDADEIFVTAGAGDGLALIVHALGPGLHMGVEDPGYPAARHVLTALGCRLTPVPVDDCGVSVDALRGMTQRPQMLLITPSHQYPLGGRLPISRRRELLQWAERHDVVVIEDDYDSEFRFGAAPLPALISLDTTGRVMHLATLSKALSPWLRVGFLVAPPALVRPLLRARRILGSPVDGITQQALTYYLEAGGLRRHIARARRDYDHRRRHLVALLAEHPRLQLHGTRAGLHAVITLPPGTDDAAVLRYCAEHGLRLASLGEYSVNAHPPPRPAVVLGYGDATLEMIRSAITTLARAVDDR